MEQLLLWLEESRLSVAIAGSQYMYPAILAAHGVGMALVVGLNTAISLRILGVAPTLPLAAMAKFSPVMWVGLWVNIISGALLTMSAATRVLVDPVFYAKMLFVAAAVVNLRLIERHLPRNDEPLGSATMPAPGGAAAVAITRPERKIWFMAAASIFLWTGAITLGRLMAYTFFRFWE